jgi:hypothetical protein
VATFSWSDLQQAAEDAGFGVIPANDYEVVVKTAEKKTTGTGKDKISVRFTVVGGPYNDKSVFNDFIISPENGTALGFFFRHMKAMGLGPEYFATKPSLEKVATDLVGRRAVLTIAIRQWNEEDKNEVKNVKPSGSAAAPMTAASSGPQPMAQPQPTPQPQPMPHPTAQPTPQPQPVTQPQPVPVISTDKEPIEEPHDEVTDIAATIETEDDSAVAEETPTKPKLPF